jgi:twitching motility protein PilT
VSQSLLPRRGGRGRQLVAEVMVTTPAIRSLIREGKTYQIPSTMQSSREHGMHTFDRELADLVSREAISYQAAFEAAHDPLEFQRSTASPRRASSTATRATSWRGASPTWASSRPR